MSYAARKLPDKPATLEDLFAIPEEARRHELIDGELVEKGAATGAHGRSQIGLSNALYSRFDRRPGGRWPGGWWFVTEVEVYFDPANTFRPDVTGWRRERSPEPPSGTPITLRPDWICEILSTNRRNDTVRKKRAYHRHGVPHYWILDPVEETLSVLRWGPDGYIDVLAAQRGELVRAEPFDAVEFQVGVFFGDEQDE